MTPAKLQNYRASPFKRKEDLTKSHFLFTLFILSYCAVFPLISHTCARVFSVKALPLVKKAYLCFSSNILSPSVILEGFGS